MKKFLFPLAALLLVLAGCKSGEAAHEDEHGHEEPGHRESVELTPAAEEIAGIEVEPATLRPMQATLQVPGVVNSTTQGRAVVTPPVAGRIVTLSVQPGDKVTKGQTLAVIESSELALSWTSIAEAQRARDAASADLKREIAELSLAQTKLTAARTNLRRQQEFVKAGAYSQAPIQQAQSELNEAQSELLSVQQEQASHAEQFRRTENLFNDGLVSKADLEAARLELQQDEIRLDKAKARVAQAKLTYEREKNISQKGLLNARELQTAEAEVRTAELERQRAEISVQSARAALANAQKAIGNAQASYRTYTGGGAASVGRVTLVAPISGIVTHLDVTRGQAIDRTQALLEVENLDSVWVTANVPEKDADKITKGASVSVHVSAAPDQEFSGIVQVVAGRLDPKTRSIPVQCLIADAKGRLKPDMFATVHLGLGASQDSLSIPKSALVSEDHASYVFVKEGKGFEKREVKLGRSNETHAEILDGLETGEPVAVKGSFVLASEQKKDELKGHEH